MKKTTIAIIIIFILGLWSLSSYNGLITNKENYQNTWAQVESQYQRRFDLIPNLVESVKGAMTQEKEVFGAISEARTRYSGASSISEKVAGSAALDSALSRLLVVMENYPQLKSTDVVRDLLTQIEGTENRISVERQRYNDSIKKYNLSVKRFPSIIFASIFGFSEEKYFESVTGSENAPKVDFKN